ARAPRAAGHWLAAAEAAQHGPVQVGVVGAAGDPMRHELETLARHSAPGGAVVLAGEPGSPAPLLADRGLVDGRAAAYVCRGFVCDRPVTTPEELRAQLCP
ncbi:MAG: N-acylglucosamine 2-epimerase, partial [Actinobacteria bacterium]|nr:N-acylglucosamine 2-epimerase [Actinomycetota bacterium]